MKAAQAVPVTRFSDYRAFLLAYVQDAKRANPRWTYGMWIRKLGLKDVSSITKVVQGQRQPGPEITEKLVKYFSFEAKDAQYFRDLIRLHKLKKDPRLVLALLEQMGKDHPNADLRILDEQAFYVISNWYCTAIREMVRMDGFFEDPQWIAKQLRFKVTPTQASTAIEKLIEVGLLKRDSQGRLQIAVGRFKTRDDFASEAIKRYHESMLENAKLAVREIPVEEREFTASTLTFKHENLPRAKELIREFKSRFCKLMEEEGGDGTFQIQIQFFPLTQKPASPGVVT